MWNLLVYDETARKFITKCIYITHMQNKMEETKTFSCNKKSRVANKNQHNIIKYLKKNEVYFIKADKIVAIVIVDPTDYMGIVENMLTNRITLTPCKNPILKFTTIVSFQYLRIVFVCYTMILDKINLF